MIEDPFVAHRSLLFTVAYEMLGSAADTEDVLQESRRRTFLSPGTSLRGRPWRAPSPAQVIVGRCPSLCCAGAVNTALDEAR